MDGGGSGLEEDVYMIGTEEKIRSQTQ